MYDEYGLIKLLSPCGFNEVRRCAADESRVGGFVQFGLDTPPDGGAYRPDSFYMEAST
jgi:hypothetical protein